MGDKKNFGMTFLTAHLSSLILLLFLTANASAQSSKEELAKTNRQIEQAKEKQQSISRERQTLEAELAILQKQLVQSAEQLQRSESMLTDAEAKLTQIETQQHTKEQDMTRAREKLATLIEAAIRLSRTPPEAMVLMPESGEKTIRAARALKMATGGIKRQAESIRLQLVELQRLSEKVAAQKDALSQQHATYLKQQQELEKTLAARRMLQEKLTTDEQKQAQDIARLAKQAEDIQELLGTIETARRARTGKQEVFEPGSEAPRGTKGKLRSFAKAKGAIRAPASGRVIQNFGAASGRNETSRGLVLQARTGASVTAPFDAEVVYAGSFMGYGRMVILRHSDDFHTLLAGLADIDAKPGEFLLEGEPIGAMGDKESTARLYVELRKNNQPIDPAPWIK